jgi:hypothetical protein
VSGAGEDSTLFGNTDAAVVTGCAWHNKREPPEANIRYPALPCIASPLAINRWDKSSWPLLVGVEAAVRPQPAGEEFNKAVV